MIKWEMHFFPKDNIFKNKYINISRFNCIGLLVWTLEWDNDNLKAENPVFHLILNIINMKN